MTTTDITINVEDLAKGDEIVAYTVWSFDHGTQIVTGSWIVGSVHWMCADRLADVYTNHGLLGFRRGDKVTVRRVQPVETDAATETETETATDTTAATRTPTGSMRRTLRRTRRNTLHAAATTTKALGYRTLSGIIATHVDAGRLVRTGDFLARVGGGHLPDGQQSWYGRHVAKAYRAANGGDPIRVWVRHRTTGRFIHVYVYGPIDPALYAGLRSYKATQHLLADMYERCA